MERSQAIPEGVPRAAKAPSSEWTRETAARSTSTSTAASRSSTLQPVTSADLRRSESKQVEIMKRLETDPDNEELLRQLQEVHHEMVTTVLVQEVHQAQNQALQVQLNRRTCHVAALRVDRR